MTLGSGGRSSCTTSGRGRQGAELVVMLVQGESPVTLRRLEARASTTVNIAGDIVDTLDTAAALTLTAACLMFSCSLMSAFHPAVQHITLGINFLFVQPEL